MWMLNYISNALWVTKPVRRIMFFFQLVHALPKFVNYLYLRPRDLAEVQPPRSSVMFNTNERLNRLVLWIVHAFPVDDSGAKSPQALSTSINGDSLHAGFSDVRTGTIVHIKMSPDQAGSSQIQIRTDSMELAGDIVQDLCRYLKLDNVESVADFPTEMAEFEQVLQRVEEFNAVRLKLSAEMADSSNLVKTYVIRAEDARILGDMTLMTQIYSRLFDLNRELIGEYNKRANNHAQLLRSLKDVNSMIQKAARLRVGDCKTQVVNACRKAIKANNVQALFKIIRIGVQ